jgi:hypothetical protein
LEIYQSFIDLFGDQALSARPNHNCRVWACTVSHLEIKAELHNLPIHQ